MVVLATTITVYAAGNRPERATGKLVPSVKLPAGNRSVRTTGELVPSVNLPAVTLNCPPDLTAVCDISEQPAYADYASFMVGGGSSSSDCGTILPATFSHSDLSSGPTCSEIISRTYTQLKMIVVLLGHVFN